MNSNTGEVKIFESIPEARKQGFDVPVETGELTSDQKERLANDDQPVVKMQDNRSTLGKKRLAKVRSKKAFNYTPPKKKRKKNKDRGRR